MGRKQDRKVAKRKRQIENKSQGHPANIAQLRRKIDADHPDTKRERTYDFRVRKLARTVRDQAVANENEGFLVGPIYAAAEYAAPIYSKHWGFGDDPQHIEGIKNFLIERIGRVIDETTSVEYRDYLDESMDRVARSGS